MTVTRWLFIPLNKYRYVPETFMITKSTGKPEASPVVPYNGMV